MKQRTLKKSIVNPQMVKQDKDIEMGTLVKKILLQQTSGFDEIIQKLTAVSDKMAGGVISQLQHQLLEQKAKNKKLQAKNSLLTKQASDLQYFLNQALNKTILGRQKKNNVLGPTEQLPPYSSSDDSSSDDRSEFKQQDQKKAALSIQNTQQNAQLLPPDSSSDSSSEYHRQELEKSQSSCNQLFIPASQAQKEVKKKLKVQRQLNNTLSRNQKSRIHKII